MKNNLKYLTILVVANLGLNACNFKKAERQTHEGETKREIVTDVRKDLAEIQSDPNWLKHVYDSMTSKDYKNAIRLSAVILGDEKSFNELNTQKVSDGTSLLGYYNYSLIENFKTNANPKENGADAYLQWALKGCDKDLNSCETINFLKRDPKSAPVIAEILKQKESTLKVEEYYRIIQLGFEISNRTRMVDLEMFYILKGKEYYDYLAKGGAKEKENLDRHAKLFQSILGQNEINKNDPKMAEWLKKLDPWRYSKSDAGFTHLGSIKIFKVAAKNFIYENKQMSASLKKVVADLRSVEDSQGISFHETLVRIQEEASGGNKEKDYWKKMPEDDKKIAIKLAKVKINVLNNFDLKIEKLLKDSTYNEYFFVVDRLFRDHFGLEEANLFWEGTTKRELELAETIRMYSKVEYLKMVFKTNLFMGNIFKQKDIPNERLFEQVVNLSQPITDDWTRFLNRVETLAIFAEQKIVGKNSTMEKVEEELRTLSSNVKYLSIYPNMMVIGDTLIDLEAEVKVPSFWGFDFIIKPKEVMKDILNGRIEKPWFIFGGDTSPLNKTQTIFSYFYGLESGVFDFFAIARGVEPKSLKIKFFQNAVKRTLSEEISKLRLAIEQMEDMNSNKDVAFQNTMAMCALINRNDVSFDIKMPTDDLMKYTLFGNSTNSYIQTLFGLYVSGPLAQYNGTRDGFESLVLQISSMMEILKLKLKGQEDQGILKELEEEIESYNEIKVKFFNVAVEQHHKVSGCVNKMVRMERDRTLDIYEKESEFFGLVWDESVKLRKITDAKAKKDALDKVKTDLKLGPNGTISDVQFIFSHWSLLSRLMEYSSKMTPPITFDIPDKEIQDKHDLVTITVPLLDLTKNVYFTRDEFISYGLRMIQAQPAGQFRWIDSMVETTPFLNKMTSIMSLYNMSFDIDKSKTKSKIEIDEVLNESKNLLGIIGISEKEAKILGKLKKRSRETKDKLVGILFDSPDSEFKGILDASFDKWLQVATDMEESINFYNAMMNLDKFVFPIPEPVTSIVDARYRAKVKAFDTRIRGIIDALTKLEASTKPDDFAIRYELAEGQKGLYSPAMIKDGNFRLVSKEVMNNAVKKLNNFHNVRTGECFVPDAVLESLGKKARGDQQCFIEKANEQKEYKEKLKGKAK